MPLVHDGDEMKTYRVGQIVPSSNTTMETEIPAMLNARKALYPDENFTFHSSRMRMQNVTPEELKKMEADSDRCVVELADAHCDVLAYACLVAIMAHGKGYQKVSQCRLEDAVKTTGGEIPVINSAGALVDSLKAYNFNKVAVITPYMKPLTERVVNYIEAEGIQVLDSISLEVADNL